MERKKSIALITFFDDNFGTCLQAYALQHAIENLGYRVEIQKYHRGKKCIVKESRWKKIFRYSPNTVFHYLLNKRFINQRKTAFRDFRRERLHFAEGDIYRDSSFELIGNKYDCYVCGSDMMWSQEFAEDWPFLFLNFASSSKTISYAPSFGKNELNEDNIFKCNQLIRSIRHLSCREEAGVKMIHDYFGLVAKHVVDPTLLFTLKSATPFTKCYIHEEKWGFG